MLRIDLHGHTDVSGDSSISPEMLLARCRAQGIGVQAITDHNEIRGALAVRSQVLAAGDDLVVIVGEEVTTREGEIIGLFLQERIEPGLSPEETVARIKAQGGLVLLPHGFDRLKRSSLRPEARERIAGSIDIVETFNARVSRRHWNRAAALWAEMHRLPMSAGSDAHTPADIGSAWVEVPAQPIRGPEDLLRALRQGVAMGEWWHPVVTLTHRAWHRILRRVRR